MQKQVMFHGTKVCQICGADLFERPLVDGKTVFGPWATMCLLCHGVNGVGLGVGRGQLYKYTNEGHVKEQGGLND